MNYPPHILLGTSQFYCWRISYGKEKALEYASKFCNAENIASIIEGSFAAGIDGIQLVPPDVAEEEYFKDLAVGVVPPILEAIKMAEEEVGAKLPVYQTAISEKSIELTEGLNRKVIMIDGNVTDNTRPYHPPPEELNWPLLMHLKKKIQKTGAALGIATHCPANTIPELQKATEFYDSIQFIMTPVNRIGYRTKPKWDRNCEAILKAAHDSGKAIIAMKPLACGRISVADGLKYLSHAPFVDAVAIALSSMQEIQETLGILTKLFK